MAFEVGKSYKAENGGHVTILSIKEDKMLGTTPCGFGVNYESSTGKCIDFDCEGKYYTNWNIPLPSQIVVFQPSVERHFPKGFQEQKILMFRDVINHPLFDLHISPEKYALLECPEAFFGTLVDRIGSISIKVK